MRLGEQNDSLLKSEYLIPDGYIGWVHIIYDQSKHPKIKKEDGTTIFRVGKDGILKVSNKDAVYGTSINKYFYVDEESYLLGMKAY